MNPDGWPGVAEFLLARIAEDEAVAHIAGEVNSRFGGSTHWEFTEDDAMTWDIRSVEQFGSPGDRHARQITFDYEGLSDSVDLAAGPHIARHDPARVLAECEAKRQVVAAVEEWRTWAANQRSESAQASAYGIAKGFEIATRFLTDPYADHPDYDEDWKT